MTTPIYTPNTPVTDVDPFSHDVLEDPLPFQAYLRAAGPIVYLEKYDVYAMGRYQEVHAALTD